MIRQIVRRGALLLVASALAAGPFACPSPAAAAAGTFTCSAGEACIHITFPDSGNAPVDVPASVIADNADITGTVYPTLDPAGDHGYDQITGLSVRELLSSVIPAAEQVDPDSVTYTLAANPSPTADYQSVLQAGDLDVDPTPFQGGQLEPAFGVLDNNNSALQYIRPQRSEDDVNSTDDFQTGSTDTTIDLQVDTEGSLVHPTVTVGTGAPWHAGDDVPFTASLAAGDPALSSPTYEWTYSRGDPPQAGGPSTAHSYAAGGTYLASVVVSAPDPTGGTYYGQSPGVSVQVGAAKKPTGPTGGNPTGGGGKGGKHHPPTGPNRGHGHHEGSSPTGGPTLGSDPSTGSPTSSPAGGGTSGGAASGSDSGGGPTPSAGAGSGDRPSASATARAGDASGTLVRGLVIDRVAAASGATPPSDATRAAASARRANRMSTPVDLRWLWVLAPLALLAAGALGERRRVPHRHGPQSRK